MAFWSRKRPSGPSIEEWERVKGLLAQLTEAIGALRAELKASKSAHDELEDAFVRYRQSRYGRLVKRPGGHERTDGGPDVQDPESRDPRDPALSKAQARALLRSKQ